jgi:hypothetical protein
MSKIDKIVQLVQEIEREAYERGREAMASHIMAAAKTQLNGEQPANRAVVAALAAGPPSGPMADRVLRVIKATPGQPGYAVIKAISDASPGSDRKSLDRTCRTAFGRLKKRGLIETRAGKWFPKEARPEN